MQKFPDIRLIGIGEGGFLLNSLRQVNPTRSIGGVAVVLPWCYNVITAVLQRVTVLWKYQLLKAKPFCLNDCMHRGTVVASEGNGYGVRG
jgi:hypothetical protein